MEFKSLANLYLVLAFLMPGFIYRGVLTQFVSLRQQSGQENLLLGYLTATVFMYVVCSPMLYWVMTVFTLTDLIGAPGRAIFIVFGILFFVPSLLAIGMAFVIQNELFARFFRKISLKHIHPIPTGWDWKFGATPPSFVLVTLTDRTLIAGWYGEDSMASSDPDSRDLFLEKVYTIPADGSPWIETLGSSGIYIDGKQIALIEFRD